MKDMEQMNVPAKVKPPKRRGRTIKQYREAIRITKGNRSAAARLLGIGRSAVSEACKRHPELAELCDSFIDEMLDVSVETIFDRALRGDEWAVDKVIRYWGHRRGIIERKEITGKEGEGLMSHETKLEAKIAILLHSEDGSLLLERLFNGFNVDGVPELVERNPNGETPQDNQE